MKSFRKLVLIAASSLLVCSSGNYGIASDKQIEQSAQNLGTVFGDLAIGFLQCELVGPLRDQVPSLMLKLDDLLSRKIMDSLMSNPLLGLSVQEDELSDVEGRPQAKKTTNDSARELLEKINEIESEHVAIAALKEKAKGIDFLKGQNFIKDARFTLDRLYEFCDIIPEYGRIANMWAAYRTYENEQAFVTTEWNLIKAARQEQLDKRKKAIDDWCAQELSKKEQK